jgi:hypothetical protein
MSQQLQRSGLSRRSAVRIDDRMRHRHPNPRLVKVHRNYTVEEVARLVGIHKNTVRNWLRQGLPAIDRHRPTLIIGSALADYLRNRRSKHKQSCRPGEIYCVKCRVPREPAGDMADYVPITPTSGNLRGICPVCDILIHRRVSLAKLDDVKGKLDVTLPQALPRITGTSTPTGNCDLDHDSA